jgi:hypothetical protein
MAIKNADLPAMPISEEDTDRIDAGVTIYTGLSKREMFAMAAMQGLLSNSTIRANIGVDGKDNSKIAGGAVAIADALLAELEKQL